MNYQEGIRRVSYLNAGFVFLSFLCLSFYQTDLASGQLTDILPLLAFIVAISLCPIVFGKMLKWSIKKSEIARLKPSLFIAMFFVLLSYVGLYLHDSSYCHTQVDIVFSYDGCMKIRWSHEKLIVSFLWLVWGSLAIIALAVWIHKLYLWCVAGFLSQSN